MEPIFTLPYYEFEAITQIQRFLKKKEGYSVFIPISRQQKGTDFLIIKNNKMLRVQVKSSRYYHNPKYKYSFWFNNFIEKYHAGAVDIYLLLGLYPEYRQSSNIKKGKFWKSIILALNDNEMKNILNMVKTKKEQKKDKFFGIGFNETDKIYGTRGFNHAIDLTKHLLTNKANKLVDDMNKPTFFRG